MRAYRNSRLKELFVCKAGLVDSDSRSVNSSCDDNTSQEIATDCDNDASQDATTNCDNDTSQEVNAKDSQRVVKLKRKLKHVQRQLRLEKKKNVEFERNLNRFLKEDQIQWLKLNCSSGRAAKWSNDTIKSSLKIRCATGAKGYDYLRNEGYPLPSYKTLCKRVENAQFQFGSHLDVLGWLKVQEDLSPSTIFEQGCLMAIDEIQFLSTGQCDEGNIL